MRIRRAGRKVAAVSVRISRVLVVFELAALLTGHCSWIVLGCGIVAVAAGSLYLRSTGRRS